MPIKWPSGLLSHPHLRRGMPNPAFSSPSLPATSSFPPCRWELMKASFPTLAVGLLP